MVANSEGVTAELYKAIVAIVDDRVKEIRVTREDFSELRRAVNELAEAQIRTEKRVEELAEVQARTEERVGRLEDAVERLALAQAKTEETVERLVNAQREISVEVGKLSTAIGFGIEDLGKVMLPGYLERHFGIEVEELERKFFLVDGEEIEINLYGEGVKKGRGIIILGEAKSRIYRREVDDFIRDVSKLTFREEVFKVMFGFFIHPSATELAEREEIVLVASYQR
jgi:predicted nuclease with TOPRIM domain